jgi:hypothetical protein
MIKIIFTSDYEIHGNGDGCPYELMVEPTDRMLRQFDQYGARLTIMADVAEILKFKDYAEEYGRDDYHYEKVAAQLRDAIRTGHDVQLHLHASYFNATFEKGRWRQDWSEYDFARLPLERLNQVIRLGKEFLESLLQPVNPNYRCHVFRAANWCVTPSRNIVKALVENGIEIDTSVYKYGQREGWLVYDYTRAHSALVPWRTSEDDICLEDENGQLLEIPIYSESRWIGAFVTPQRLYRAFVGRRHNFSEYNAGPPPHADDAERNGSNGSNGRRKSHWLFQKHAWKADFNQCSGRQLIEAVKRANHTHVHNGSVLPFVLIGHSKLFTEFNQRSLQPFLSFVTNHPARFGFGVFKDFSGIPTAVVKSPARRRAEDAAVL